MYTHFPDESQCDARVDLYRAFPNACTHLEFVCPCVKLRRKYRNKVCAIRYMRYTEQRRSYLVGKLGAIVRFKRRTNIDGYVSSSDFLRRA